MAIQNAWSGNELWKCDRRGCPHYVAVGPGTGRWRHKRPVYYCSPKCQKAAAYERLKELENERFDHPPRQKVVAAQV